MTLKRVASAKTECVKKTKSAARQAAGKHKAVSLEEWQKDLSDARKALKDEGYTGSLRLKKGTPLFQKIQSIRQLVWLIPSPWVLVASSMRARRQALQACQQRPRRRCPMGRIILRCIAMLCHRRQLHCEYEASVATLM